MKYLTICFCLILAGCASSGSAIKTSDGVKFEASKDSLIRYKDKDIEAEFDTRGQPLINIGDVPDVKLR